MMNTFTSVETGFDGGAYRQIFSEVRTASELRHAIAKAVRQLRQSMEKEDNFNVTAAHIRNLEDIAPETLATAYSQAEKSCTFWPTPAQIRELAGCSEESEAAEALQWVFEYLERHGVAGHAWGGGVVFGDDGEGRRVALGTAQQVAAPEMPAAIDQVLTALGCGSKKDGLHYISQHPRVKGWDGYASDRAAETAERIERQWLRCYRRRWRICSRAPQ